MQPVLIVICFVFTYALRIDAARGGKFKLLGFSSSLVIGRTFICLKNLEDYIVPDKLIKDLIYV